MSAASGEHGSMWPLEGLGYFRDSLMREVVSSKVAEATVLRKVLNALDYHKAARVKEQGSHVQEPQINWGIEWESVRLMSL